MEYYLGILIQYLSGITPHVIRRKCYRILLALLDFFLIVNPCIGSILSNSPANLRIGKNHQIKRLSPGELIPL